MAFDQNTRNRLQKLVSDCRKLLSEEFSIQLQQTYGIDPHSGEVAGLDRLTHLSDRDRQTAQLLRDTLAHYLAVDADDKAHRIAAIDRIIREQAFTVLNRLAALLMMEARGLLAAAVVSQGQQSQAFELYKMVCGSSLGETGEAYRTFLFSLFDEFAIDLPALFDRYAAQGRLFPREPALLEVLEALNHHEIQSLWAEDETIGWIYQYFNSKEERKAMRDASQAPRNSRELAVRNQFFTPRYVVEFLIDNTLGRIWFNATGGQTGLRERCQYLLVKPDENPQVSARLRDPRTLKLLDPACGSMHFGLYAFDLFLHIYQEAWDWEQAHGPGSLDVSIQPNAGLMPLCLTYADRDNYLRDVPRLIVEHNIYGVDIDPRAAQIASLALWLRSQRAWHAAGVKAQQRPDVGRGHVVAAVAPPAERELRVQFTASLDKRDADLFEKTLQLLKGLPELGVLLQVEKDLPALIRQVYGGVGRGLFAEEEMESWVRAEERLRKALIDFAQTAKSTYQERLFSQDALEGLRLIDLVRDKFDVVVMNPPFGLVVAERVEYLKLAYPDSYTDLLANFIERANQLCRGRVGAITSRSFMVATRLAGLRNQIIKRLCLLADLGDNIMDDAFVEAAAYVLDVDGVEKLTAFDLRNLDNKKTGLLEACKFEVTDNVYSVPTDIFLNFPKSRITYFAGDDISSLLMSSLKFEPVAGTARQGLTTFDDSRLVRVFWEVSSSEVGFSRRWEYLAKGGAFSRYMPNVHLLMKWGTDGSESRAINLSKNGTDAQAKQASDYWRMPGLTYSIRSQRGFSARVLPGGCLFTGQGPLITTQSEISNEYLLGWINSSLIRTMIEIQSNDGKFMSGLIKSLPWVSPGDEQVSQIETLTTSVCLELIEYESSTSVTSPYFKGFVIGDTIEQMYRDVCDWAHRLKYNVANLDGCWDDYVLNLYNVKESVVKKVREQISFDLSESDDEGDDSESGSVDLYGFCAELIDWLAGIAFGRWALPCKAGKSISLGLESPFDNLPSCPPAMLANSSTEFFSGASGVLVDDSESPDDIVRKIQNLISLIWGDKDQSIEREVCEILGVDDLRSYFAKSSGFFYSHLKRHSKSRRQAPLYWPLSTLSGGYAIWVYYQELNEQTFFKIVNDHLDGPSGKLTRVSRVCSELREKGNGRSRTEEKQYEDIQVFEQELLELRDLLLKVASDYRPNSDDGVQITASPLWRLFRHKPWQKLLKDTWAKLEKGDYDWAHLAMNYWPERVRNKCATDKSLAIAHGVEHLYVEPEPTAKKTRGRKKAGSTE